jgi:AAHS family 4-hydroxybenzoate transporter-like MFS transporter
MFKLGHAVDARCGFVDGTEQPTAREGGVIAALVGTDYRRDTVALWVSFFACLTCVYMSFSWLPTMLASQGLALRVTSAGLAFYNFGGVLGPLACVWLVRSFGSRRPLLTFCFGGALSAFSLNAIDMSANADHFVLFSNLAVHGFFVNGVQTSLYALAAHVYVTRVRASGVAGALSIGRIGAISSSFIGAWAIQTGGVSVYVAMLGGAMLIALLGVAAVSRQIPPARPPPRLGR